MKYIALILAVPFLIVSCANTGEEESNVPDAQKVTSTKETTKAISKTTPVPIRIIETSKPMDNPVALKQREDFIKYNNPVSHYPELENADSILTQEQLSRETTPIIDTSPSNVITAPTTP